ncbi:MAG: DUF839 domain-containing protein [Kordiimonadaceae bacterium]|jgi:uncharacterized protein|nr:DUF839 domain-containing protein [Kordiimonadaceae bacterium]MBT6036685.1 DUF839 domain-containing protein [Kordiimonadaceae bacterium]MBT6330460.1 DUF839 domain-containing protein [Kordiimonadaceae bacterium]
MHITRRNFTKSATMLAFSGLLNNCAGTMLTVRENAQTDYGPLIKDPDNILDLPQGFSYKVISALGDMMDDGYPVPDRADGMGCFALEGSKVALIRNHELGLWNNDPEHLKLLKPLAPVAYDQNDAGEPLPGGTTTIIYDLATGERLREYTSLIGTSLNCAGGITPWNSWLTCEETEIKAGEDGQRDHGWVFEVPVAGEELVRIDPIKQMGRFKHEAAAVDPSTGIVYMTEDQSNSLFYRYIPNVYGDLHKGGKLQALGIKDESKAFDSRNWDGVTFDQESWRDARWIDLDEVESPNNDLRVRGINKGAAIFARGEGITWGDGELYFCCTTGGTKSLGQIMRYIPSPNEGTRQEDNDPGRLQLFLESADNDTFGLGDNLTVAPNGHLIVSEDHYDKSINYIRGVTPEGKPYTLAKVNVKTETAGGCFSPDGNTFFINLQVPTMTLAIKGPWDQISG